MPRKIWYSETADVFPGIIAKNNAVLEYEKFIHRSFYPWIIHPYSFFRVSQQKFYLVAIPVRLTVISVLWAVFPHESYLYQVPKLLFQIVNMIDVIFKFFVGYVESDTETVVLDPQKIAKKYLLTFFIFDFIPCVPFELLTLILDKTCIKNSASKCHATVDFATLSVVLRLVSLFKYCRDLGKILLWNYFLMSMICVGFLLYTTLIFTNDFYTMLYITETSHKANTTFLSVSEISLGDRLLEYLNAMMTVLLDCLYYDTISPIANVYLRCFILITTFFTSILFMAYFIKYFIIKMKAKDEDKFFDLESRVVSFVKKKRLSSSLASKTLLYFQILLQNKYHGRDDELFNYIPETFKADIFFHLCLPLLKNFYAFEGLPTYVLRRLAESMKYQLHLPNEVIMRSEDERVSMYFVQRGTVALYSLKHVELYHFESGSSFNGRNMILGETKNNAYAISIEVVEEYRLDQDDFFEIMATYPKLLKQVQETFRDKRNDSIMD